jgi:hypothetical protein
LNAAIKAAVDEKKREALCEKLKRLRTYNNSRKISSTLELVRGELFTPDFVQQLDANPDILNVGNGVLLLRTGELDLHRPEYMCSKIAETDFMVSPPLRSTTKTKCPVSWRILQLDCSDCFSMVWQVLLILPVLSYYHTHMALKTKPLAFCFSAAGSLDSIRIALRSPLWTDAIGFLLCCVVEGKELVYTHFLKF